MIEIICEIASNHGGDMHLAEAFIEGCAEAGADWVKFQSYQVATLRPDDPQREWLAKAELSDADHETLMKACDKAHVKFLTTAFHHSRVPFLASLGLQTIKIGSGEANEPSLYEAVKTSTIRQAFVSFGYNQRIANTPWYAMPLKTFST